MQFNQVAAAPSTVYARQRLAPAALSPGFLRFLRFTRNRGFFPWWFATASSVLAEALQRTYERMLLIVLVILDARKR
jgi:hypothetical protein